MSKRGLKIPAPFLKTLPSVIRSFGPRLVITAAACAVLLVCTGGAYLLSHENPAPTSKAPVKPINKVKSDKSPEAQVLGETTQQASSSPPSQTTPASLPNDPTPSTNSQATSAAPSQGSQATNDQKKITASPQTTVPAPVSVSTSPKQTSVNVHLPAGGLSLNLPIGL